jgi:ABC-type Mn2+/Zn2+ transport system permease subunit
MSSSAATTSCRPGDRVLREWFVDPYRAQFMRNAAGIALLVGVLAPTVGVWVVLRRLAYLGDAMSHGTLAGVAGAYLAGISVSVGALAAGLVMGFLVTRAEDDRRLGQDTVIGVAETLLFAVGVLVISQTDRIGVDITHYLFGQLITTDRQDLLIAAGLTAAALVVVALAFDDLRAMTFDPGHARQVGIPVGALRLVLMCLISVTVVVSLDTVGLLLSVALLVTPAAGARLVTERIGTMTAVAIGVGVTSCLGGLTLAYHLATPPGPTIALLTVAWFVALAGSDRLRSRVTRRAAVPEVLPA